MFKAWGWEHYFLGCHFPWILFLFPPVMTETYREEILLTHVVLNTCHVTFCSRTFSDNTFHNFGTHSEKVILTCWFLVWPPNSQGILPIEYDVGYALSAFTSVHQRVQARRMKQHVNAPSLRFECVRVFFQ